MDFLTASILSGIVYDMVKNQVSLTSRNIQTRLKGWIVDDSVVERITYELNTLSITDEMSEKSIEKRLSQSQELIALMKNVQTNTAVSQNHSGSGDNVVNKYVFSRDPT